jgi:hypothetical protein
MKAILVFFAVFLFINLLSIYIMGGFYNQTETSKGITQLLACILGGIFGAIYYENNKQK